MSVQDQPPSLLVLTEDSGADALAVVSALLKRLLVYLDPRCQTHKITFEPAPDLDDIVHANLWTGRRAERIRLHRRLAQKLFNHDGFVVHHLDADQTWARREESVNVGKLRADILPHVRRQLFDRYRRDMPTASDQSLHSLVDARMTRYFCMLPHWEIESWLYQNTERAALLCPGPPACRRTPTCRDKLATWSSDRGALDEVPHASDELCLGKAHNLALVQGYPTAAVVGARRSLAAAVDAMLACDALLDAIQRTSETPAGGPGSV